MRFKGLIIIAALASAIAVPFTASAYDGCNTEIVVFSRPSGLNTQAAACLAAEEDMRDLNYDPRIINPGSNGVSVRLTRDVSPDVPELTAVLNGLGFVDHEVTLRRVQTATGSWVYDSTTVEIDPAATGCLRVSIESQAAANAYHTITASC